MRTTLARQLRRLAYNPEDIPGVDSRPELIIKWRAAHPRKPRQQPAKKHRRSKNRR